jgi:hypothetical protein
MDGHHEEDLGDGSKEYLLRPPARSPAGTPTADAIIHTESAEENADPFTPASSSPPGVWN